ncbi:MAG: LytR/AlgR family response regulator transcription factor [Clostridia bacterium]
MLKIVICEDDIQQRDRLKSIIDDYIIELDMLAEIDLVTSEATQLQDYVDNSLSDVNKNIRVYFLDIDLKQELTGLDLAHYIRTKDVNAYIIFITFMQRHIKNVFRYKTFDFISKTYYDQLSENIKDVMARLKEDYNQFYGSLDKKITLKFENDEIVRSIPIDDFIGIKRENNIYVAYTTQGVFRYFSTLQSILDSTEKNDSLIRTHQSVIVNVKHIKSIDRNKRKVVATNGIEFDISRRKMKEVLNKWYIN